MAPAGRSYIWRFSILLGMLGLVGCSSGWVGISLEGLPFLGRVTPIERIQSRAEADYTVRLRGTVGDRLPLLNGQIYQLQDSTGKIWVLSSDTTLETGDQVLIRGRVRFQSIPLAGQEQGEFYIEELSQLERNNANLRSFNFSLASLIGLIQVNEHGGGALPQLL